MRTGFLNKSVTNHESKVDPRLQEAFDLNTARLRAAEALSADEQNAVGHAVARAAEYASRSSSSHELHQRMVEAAEHSKDEAEVIAEALASWSAARAEVAEARRDGAEAYKAEEGIRYGPGYGEARGPEYRREFADAQARSEAARRRLGLAEEALSYAESHLGRVRGYAAEAGRWRVRQLVERGI